MNYSYLTVPTDTASQNMSSKGIRRDA